LVGRKQIAEKGTISRLGEASTLISRENSLQNPVSPAFSGHFPLQFDDQSV
jgi:hypothetical protein